MYSSHQVYVTLFHNACLKLYKASEIGHMIENVIQLTVIIRRK